MEFSPVAEVVVELRNFYNVDLHLRGYYHIRARLRPAQKHGAAKVDVRVPRSSAPSVFPASVVEGQAVGKTIEILYADEELFLDDTFHFSVRLPQRVDKMSPIFEFCLTLELWFCEKEQMLKKTNKDLVEVFRCVSRRSVRPKMSLATGLHAFRPLLFDYQNLAAITVAIHASLVGLDHKQTKTHKKNSSPHSTGNSSSSLNASPGPSPSLTPAPLTDKIRQLHRAVCFLLLAAYESLQLKTKSLAHLFPAKYQIRIQLVDTAGKLEALCRRLTEEPDPWTAMDQDRQLLSQELSVLWAQFLDLFRGRSEVDQVLGTEHHNSRIKRFAEGFFHTEDTMHGLIASSFTASCHSLNFYSRLVDLMKRSNYFAQLPQLAFFCAELDGDSTSIPVIFEEKYIHPLSRKCSRLPSLNLEEESRRWSRSSSITKKLSPEKMVRALKNSLCLDLVHRNRPASTCSNEAPPPSSFRNTEQDGEIQLEEVILDTSPESAVDESPSYLTVSGSFLSERCCSEPNLIYDRFRGSTFFDGPMSSGCSDSNLNVIGSRLPATPLPNRRLKVHFGKVPTDSPQSGQFCCLPLCAAAGPVENGHDSSDSSPVDGESFSGTQLTAAVEESLVEFVRAKEQFKEKLSLAGYHGHLCSDFMRVGSSLPYFSAPLRRPMPKETRHLIVCVHGLDGCSSDLRPYRTFIRLGLPKESLDFLMSESNQHETFNDFETMSRNFVDEILVHMARSPVQPTRISFIAHSLGAIIVRSALCDPRLEPLLQRLHCFLSLNGPHCGVVYNQRAFNWGLSLVQWWKSSKSLEQLALRDKDVLRETFLYKLSKESGLASFKYVLLVGSSQDMYVPCHSALIQPCKAAQKDPGALGVVYGEMVRNVLESVATSSRGTTLVRTTAFHGLSGISRTHQVLGRAAHIAVLDDDIFIEKLLSVSALHYFL